MSTSLQEQKYVSFKLNDEYYAIDVYQVSEVFTPSSITEIPQAPAWTSGVINYRGLIVTVIDLKQRLNMEDIKVEADSDFGEDEEKFYVIIVKQGDTSIGLLVDHVESVIGIESDKIQSGIDLISGTEQASFLSGIAQTDMGLVVLLSIEALLSEYDISEIEKFAELRSKLITKDEDEIVVEHEQLVDLDKDDISDWEADSKDEFKKIDDTQYQDEGGLDLNALTKAELLKIAIEMKLDGITTKSTKADIINSINIGLGNT